MKAQKKKTPVWVKAVLLFFLCVGAIYAGFPIFWMFVSSFKPNTEIFANARPMMAIICAGWMWWWRSWTWTETRCCRRARWARWC